MNEIYIPNLRKLHYFLGFKVIQSCNRILISQKICLRNLRKNWIKNCYLVSTPFEFSLKLNEDNEGNKVNGTLYKQIIRNLMYLISIGAYIIY